MGVFSKYIFMVFVSFNAVVSVGLRAGRVRQGWCGVRPICFFLPEGLCGAQNKFEQNSRGVKANKKKFCTFRPGYFFSHRVRQEGGYDPGQLKKFGQGGHMGVLTNIYFDVFFYLLQ